MTKDWGSGKAPPAYAINLIAEACGLRVSAPSVPEDVAAGVVQEQDDFQVVPVAEAVSLAWQWLDEAQVAPAAVRAWSPV
jgi:hypothetical protein